MLRRRGANPANMKTLRTLLKFLVDALIPYFFVFGCLLFVILFVAYVEYGRSKPRPPSICVALIASC